MFSADVEYQGQKNESGSWIVRMQAQLDGVLQNGGRSMQMATEIKGVLSSEAQTHALHALADAVTEQGTERYVRLRSLTIEPPHPSIVQESIVTVQGQWWRLAPGLSGGSALFMTPDPSLLRAQAEILRVTRDRGIQRIHGKDAYRYDVTVDPVRLLLYLQRVAEQSGQAFDRVEAAELLALYDATGELWIDAETFLPHRISWQVSLRADALRVFALTVDLTRHNDADPVRPPADAQDLSVESLATLFRGAGTAVDLPPQDDDSVLRDIFY